MEIARKPPTAFWLSSRLVLSNGLTSASGPPPTPTMEEVKSQAKKLMMQIVNPFLSF
jgi:hypothetical protein